MTANQQKVSRRTPDDDRLTKQGLLKLTELREKRRRVEAEIDATVGMLRSPGLDGSCLASWREVGDALGVRPQSAQERYRDLSWQGSGLDDR